MLDIRKFTRRPFDVEAVQVTEENIEEVAEWCGGIVRQSAGRPGNPKGASNVERYIRVDSPRALNEKQKRAFIGDWVLKSPTGYKVYPDTSFNKSFTVEPETQAGPGGNVFEQAETPDAEAGINEIIEQMAENDKEPDDRHRLSTFFDTRGS